MRPRRDLRAERTKLAARCALILALRRDQPRAVLKQFLNPETSGVKCLDNEVEPSRAAASAGSSVELFVAVDDGIADLVEDQFEIGRSKGKYGRRCGLLGDRFETGDPVCRTTGSLRP